jgi:hypothetical protein
MTSSLLPFGMFASLKVSVRSRGFFDMAKVHFEGSRAGLNLEHASDSTVDKEVIGVTLTGTRCSGGPKKNTFRDDMLTTQGKSLVSCLPWSLPQTIASLRTSFSISQI